MDFSSALKQNRLALLETLRVDPNVLDHLVTHGVLTMEQYNKLSLDFLYPLAKDKARGLLDLLSRRGEHNYTKFLDVMKATQQHEVVKILTGSPEEKEVVKVSSMNVMGRINKKK